MASDILLDMSAPDVVEGVYEPDEPESSSIVLPDRDPCPVDSVRLRRSLNIYDGIGVSVGIMIGSGIFASPGVTLERCASPGAALLAWIVAGALVMCASFCYAELATSIPDAGGDFAYLKRAYGDVVAFAFAWYNFWVGKTASQAIIATVFSQYLISGLFGLNFLHSAHGTFAAKFAAISLLIILCLINCFGAKESASVTNVLTALKLLLVLSLFVSALVYAITVDDLAGPTRVSTEGTFAGTTVSGFFGGMIPALWSYDGWADLNFMAEELINPQRLLPRVVFISVAVVVMSYISANVAYMAVLDISTIIDSHSVAVEFGGRVAGPWFSVVLSLGVALSAAGSANGSVMTGGRAFYAVARAGQAPSALAKLNGCGSPMIALVAQMFWSIVLLCLPGSDFATLLDYFGPASWFFYALAGFGVVVLRMKEPSLHRPYSVLLYPIPPLVLIILSAFVIGSAILSSPFFTLLALIFVSSSVPVYYLTSYFQLFCFREKSAMTVTSQFLGLHVNETAMKTAENLQKNDKWTGKSFSPLYSSLDLTDSCEQDW